MSSLYFRVECFNDIIQKLCSDVRSSNTRACLPVKSSNRVKISNETKSGEKYRELGYSANIQYILMKLNLRTDCRSHHSYLTSRWQYII